MSGTETAAFASFLGAGAGHRVRARRGATFFLSVLVHLGILVVIARARVPGQPPLPRPREPLFVKLAPPLAAADAGQSRSSVKPMPRQARAARRRPLIQPSLPSPDAPLAPDPALAPVEDAEETAQEEAADAAPPESTPAAGSVAVPGGRAGGLAGATGDAALELAAVARPPAVLSQVTPEYPREARRKRIEGLVVVRVIIGLDGRVERQHTRIVRSHPALDVAAIAAVEKWRFSPAIGHSGQPVRVVIEVPFQFFLR